MGLTMAAGQADCWYLMDLWVVASKTLKPDSSVPFFPCVPELFLERHIHVDLEIPLSLMHLFYVKVPLAKKFLSTCETGSKAVVKAGPSINSVN